MKKKEEESLNEGEAVDAVWDGSGTTRRKKEVVTWRQARFELLSGKEKDLREGAKERDRLGAPLPSSHSADEKKEQEGTG